MPVFLVPERRHWKNVFQSVEWSAETGFLATSSAVMANGTLTTTKVSAQSFSPPWGAMHASERYHRDSRLKVLEDTTDHWCYLASYTEALYLPSGGMTSLRLLVLLPDFLDAYSITNNLRLVPRHVKTRKTRRNCPVNHPFGRP